MPSAMSACAIPPIPAAILLSRSRSPALIEAGDILEFTLDSEPVAPATVELYAERVIHGCIYQARPDVMAVCHHHAPAVMPFCVAGVPLVPVFHVAAVMGETVPFWDQRDEFGDSNLLVVTPEEGRSLARALGPHSAVLMRRHGATVVGAGVRELVFRSIAMCQNAEYQMRALALGSFGPLTPARPSSLRPSICRPGRCRAPGTIGPRGRRKPGIERARHGFADRRD